MLLDEVDKELEKRGHAFVRYADDCNVYVRSQRAGERVMETLRRLYAKLQLRINESKSAVARPWDRKFLGYSFWVRQGTRGQTARREQGPCGDEAAGPRPHGTEPRPKHADSGGGAARATSLGWKEYFHLADTPGSSAISTRGSATACERSNSNTGSAESTVYRELRARGLSERKVDKVARNTKSWWRNSGLEISIALPVSHFDDLGVPRLAGSPMGNLHSLSGRGER